MTGECSTHLVPRNYGLFEVSGPLLKFTGSGHIVARPLGPMSGFSLGQGLPTQGGLNKGEIFL